MATPAPAGKRDKRITLQKLMEQNDESGFPQMVPSGVTIGVLAARNDLTNSGWSRERNAADQTSARLETEWKLPYLPACEPIGSMTKWYRLVDDQGVVCDIVIAAEIGRRHGIVLTTTAKVDA